MNSVIAAEGVGPSSTATGSDDVAIAQATSLLISILTFLPTLLLTIVSFVTITLPTWLFSLLSTSLTLTVNMTTVLIIVVLIVSTISWLVRYRWLNMYTRLPQNPQREEPAVEVFPETQETDSRPGLSNYLDEFLSAIKVFGYLERPVFHELTRTMQTRKLIAGETLLLEQERGFCLVVDGSVQIFVKSSVTADRDDTRRSSSPYPDEEHTGPGNQGYQLLTEVKNGAPMSSLFSILSLFTEDVKLRHDGQEDYLDYVNADNPFVRPVIRRNFSNASGLDGSVTPLTFNDSPRYGNNRRRTSTFDQTGAVPAFSLEHGDDDDAEVPPSPSKKKPSSIRGKTGPRHPSVHPDIVARASVDTTIAIIPASAFQRLTRVYPKATAHIVQVILTRLQRVTLATSHSYLGLTSEVLRTEKLMDRYTSHDLPDFLHGEAMDRLKNKFRAEMERVGATDGSEGIALHNPRAKSNRQTSQSLRKDAAIARLTSPTGGSQRQARERTDRPTSPASMADMTPTRSRESASILVDEYRSGISAGDLLTGSSSRSSSSRGTRQSFSQPYQTPRPLSKDHLRSNSPFIPAGHQRIQLQRQDSFDEDLVYREAILKCMTQAIGLGTPSEAAKPASSVPQSPRLVSYDSRRQKAVFNNAFGFMDAYDAFADADSESAPSVSAMSAVGSTALLEDMKNEVEIVFFPQGSVLVEKGERNPGLYYVIDGFLDVCLAGEDAQQSGNVLGTAPREEEEQYTTIDTDFDQDRDRARRSFATSTANPRRKSRKSQRRSLFVTKPGGLAGYLGTISSHRSFVDVVAKTDVYVGFLPIAIVEKIVERNPVVLLTLAKRLTTLLPRLILHIDFALEWVQVNAGQVIYHEKDESDAIFLVLNGRLRGIRESKDGKVKVLGEYGQGESVGELEVLTESARPGSLHAIRDTELCRIPRSLFNSLSAEHPTITIKISKIIASRMRSFMENPAIDGQLNDRRAILERSTTSTNLRTVTILPITAGVPVVEFGHRLLGALNQVGVTNGVTSLNQTAILNHLGRHAFSRMGKLKLSQHLADLEEKYGLVLYVADTNVKSPWTQTCVSQADCVLLVGLAEGSPGIGEYERFLLTTKTTARKELVLLHSERYCAPGLTRAWLRNRPWINGGHHHIQMAYRAPTEPVQPQLRRFGTAIKQRVQEIQAEIQKYTSRRVRQTPMYSTEAPYKSDFHRLARRICGKSVGLVLGGGGARGIAHVGIIRALEEAGIPVDMVGGTSIGSFIGALYAWDADVVPMYGRAKKFAGRMGSMWRFALDLTYPSAAYTTGHEFNRGIFKTFGNSQIEDFWLDFYCNTTNITKGKSEIHNSGYVWRYVRASMSLAGLIPPLCDEGNMLLDGGYIDNLTVAHMKSLGADVIFAVDVGAVDDDSPQEYGDSLSGFWAFVNRYNPFSSYANPPTLSEIQARLAYVSSIGALEKAKSTPGCRYLRPPVENYGTLEFGKFQEIYDCGYAYGKQYLEQLKEQGVLPVTEELEDKMNMRRTMAPRRASV